MKLNLNCEVSYHKDFLSAAEINELFKELNEVLKDINYTPETMDGVAYTVNFNKVMFLDKELLVKDKFPESHWGPTRKWSKTLNKLKRKIEEFTKQEFKVCVLIYYPDGNSGVDYHSDYTAFGDTSYIPSVSLGEEREFLFREKGTSKETSIHLANGSLVIMGKNCQDLYEHSLPINSNYKNPRINLTFRKYGFDN